ncbi:TolC family protein [bacterium]|nr:TolC family protein [bacterium]
MYGKFIKRILIFTFTLMIGNFAFAIDDVIAPAQDEKEMQPLVSEISFDEVLDKAIEHSYDVKIADFKILISKQEVRGAKSEYFPKLNVGLGAEYTKNFRDKEYTVMSIGDSFINPYTRFQTVMGISLYYNVYDFGIREGNVKHAKEDVELQSLKELEQQQELELSIVDNYSKLLITSKQIAQNKAILKLEQQNLDFKNRLYNAGEATKLEVNDAKVKVANLQNRIAELQGIYNESLLWLSFYTGEEYDSKNLKVADIKKPDFDVLAFNDYTQSLVWKIQDKEIKKKELELKVAKRANYPKLGAYTKYNIYGADEDSVPRTMKDIGPSNWSIGLSLNIPVFDGFKASANAKKVALELEQLLVERDKAVAQLMTRLSVMRSNLMYLEEQIYQNENTINELKSKEKSIKRLVKKRAATPIDENEVMVQLLEQQIELDKNKTTAVAIIKGIEFLTKEIDEKAIKK